MPLFPWSQNPARRFSEFVATDTGPTTVQAPRGLSALVEPDMYDDEMIEWSDRQLDAIAAVLMHAAGAALSSRPGEGMRALVRQYVADVEALLPALDGGGGFQPVRYLAPVD